MKHEQRNDADDLTRWLCKYPKHIVIGALLSSCLCLRDSARIKEEVLFAAIDDNLKKTQEENERFKILKEAVSFEQFDEHVRRCRTLEREYQRFSKEIDKLQGRLKNGQKDD